MNWTSENKRYRAYEEYDISDEIGSVNYQSKLYNKMNKIGKIFSSRTVWSVVVLFVVNGVTGIHDFIPESILPIIKEPHGEMLKI